MLVIMVILLASLCLAPVLLLMGRRRQEAPSVLSISPDCAQRHNALVWLIRGTGAVIAGASVIAAIYFVYGIIIDAIRGQSGTLGWIGVPIIILIFVAILSLFFKIGYEMFRMQNTITVANFAFTVTILFAWDIYHLLPLRLPSRITGFDEHQALLYPAGAEASNHTSKEAIAFIAGYFFYKITKTILLRILDLNLPTSPQNQSSLTPPAPEVPEFPQKSPPVLL